MKVDAILVSDIHLRETQPECRLDDFMEAQTRKLRWLKKLQEELNVPILCGGDLFDYWKPSPFLLSYAFRELPDAIISVPGQHDLPAHNLDNIERSGIQVLADGGKIKLLTNSSMVYPNNRFHVCGFPWGSKLSGITTWQRPLNAAIIHYGVYEKVPHYPGAENSGGNAKSIIKRMKGFDLILSGDNHLSFTAEQDDCVLVNPGSFMRTSAAQIDHKPSVYLWDALSNKVEQVFIPIEKGVVSREHINEVTERDKRLEAFVSKLNHNVELGISFKTNLKNYLAKNKVPKSIEKLIWEAMEVTK